MPLELISMGASALMGFLFKLISANQQAKRDQFEMMMQKEKFAEESRQAARNMQNPAAAYIRRFIVITMMSILAFIVVAPAIDPTLTTNIVTEYDDPGFLGFGGGKRMMIAMVSGVMYDETIRSILASIIGYYFGTSTVK
jgi:hypothetical protein